MDTTSKNRGLIIAIGILLVANIVLLSFFLLNKRDGKRPGPDHKGPMTVYLQNEVGFNDEQMAEFETVRTDHRSQVKELLDRIRNNKEKVFRELGANAFSDSAITDAAAYSAMQQKDLEINMLKHIRNIRNICTPEQKIRFDTGFYKIMNRPKEPRAPNSNDK